MKTKSHFARLIGASLLCAAPFAATQAQAHAGLQPAQTGPGKSYRAVIGIGHGCDGAATTSVRVSLPDGFYNAKPMPKPGWTLKVIEGAYAQPFDNYGTSMRAGARQIIWSGGTLDDAWFDEFIIKGSIGPDVAPDSKLFFPTLQECGAASIDWADTSGSHDADPAPYVTVTATEPGADDHHAHGAADPAAVTLGALTLSQPFTRAMAPHAPVGGGYVTITNTGNSDDRLISATSDAAAQTQIHEMTMQGDVMKMRELSDGLPIPAGQTVTLAPGGLHLMFMGVKTPFAEGQQIKVTLVFEKAGAVEIALPVGAMSAKAPMGEHAGH